MQTSLFKSKVEDLIQLVLSLNVSAYMQWEYFVEKLQDVIRDCGKFFSKVLNFAKCEAHQLIYIMTEKVDAGIVLSNNEYVRLCKAYKCLEFIENQAIQTSKVKARCMEVNDLHANSKCFFDFLRIKRLKDMISQFHLDGSVLNDGNSMAAACSEHFRKLFGASYKSDGAWFDSLQESLRYTPRKVDSHMAAACEKSISEEEVYIALQSLRNGKALGLDGITKEFLVCNEIWREQKMPYSFKLGKIKLIPKMDILKCIGDWRPITMMGIMLKYIAHKVVHPMQIGFIHQRSIYDNIFLTQILLDHAAVTNQEEIGMQIDFEKAFDLIRWDFIAVVLKKLGFGDRFCRLIYILAQGNASRVEINERLSEPFTIECSVLQGSLSPMFYLLEAKMNSQCIHGISIYGIQQIAVGFVDDTFIFEASSLKINMKKSKIINISAPHFQSLKWDGPKIERGIVFKHLGYPLGIGVTIKDKSDWVLRRIKGKMENLVKNFLCSSWEYVFQPRDRGGLGILNLHTRLMARREAFFLRITSSQRPLWAPIFWKLVESAEVNFKGCWKLDEWNKFFSHAPLQTSSYTVNFLIHHFKFALSTLKWNGRQPYAGNSLASLSPFWSFLSNPPIAYSLGAATRYFNNKGIDSIAKCYNSKWEILSFPEVRRLYAVGAAYRSKWLQVVSLLHKYQIERLVVSRWWIGKLNMYYCTLIAFDKFLLGILRKHGMLGIRCLHCSSYVENMRHAFWSCAFIQKWWNILMLFPIWDVKPTKFGCTFLLFHSNNNAKDWIRKRCVLLLLHNIWLLRNFKMFRNKRPAPAFSWQYCKTLLWLDGMSCLNLTEFALPHC
ncbi:hypothetical protein KP509_27G044400 [Ceratopteris richardii]|uniref:Reverse transcriptase domain-containing protein n=1 Tax=Ceratopteris richardii TaxID=49495 RepID=A0A8T2RG47_CERRI|nr:hypothetical protein KP509_27G044400 [Ceratopteris richardii]